MSRMEGEVTQAKDSTPNRLGPECRRAVAQAMADGRERTLADMTRVVEFTSRQISCACVWMVRHRLLAVDILDGCRVYRRADFQEAT